MSSSRLEQAYSRVYKNAHDQKDVTLIKALEKSYPLLKFQDPNVIKTFAFIGTATKPGFDIPLLRFIAGCQGDLYKAMQLCVSTNDVHSAKRLRALGVPYPKQVFDPPQGFKHLYTKNHANRWTLIP